MAGPKREPVMLTDDERQLLEGWARRRKTALALRSRIVLACADGALVSAVAAELGISRATAGKWRWRFLAGLYMNPPEIALVLCVDEEPQTQALDRTASCLPLLPTTPARLTHDYVRNGTPSLFAAFDLAIGSVIAQHYRRRRPQKFLRFLKLIDQAVPQDLDLHLVLDNYATCKTPEIHSWRLRHPRFHLHFTLTSSFWLNLVECWFAEVTNRKLRRSAHRSVTELEADIRKWINERNERINDCTLEDYALCRRSMVMKPWPLI
jgi:transposase/transposase-like protein